jgi:TPR repeat protein
MKRLFSIIALCIVFFFLFIWLFVATDGRPEPLWSWQVSSYRKLAEAGDGEAQYIIAEHYLAEENIEESDFWYWKCLMSKEPICLYEKAIELYGHATMGVPRTAEENEQLDSAMSYLNLAERNLKSDDLLKEREIQKLRKKIVRAQNDPTYKR